MDNHSGTWTTRVGKTRPPSDYDLCEFNLAVVPDDVLEKAETLEASTEELEAQKEQEKEADREEQSPYVTHPAIRKWKSEDFINWLKEEWCRGEDPLSSERPVLVEIRAVEWRLKAHHISGYNLDLLLDEESYDKIFSGLPSVGLRADLVKAVKFLLGHEELNNPPKGVNLKGPTGSTRRTVNIAVRFTDEDKLRLRLCRIMQGSKLHITVFNNEVFPVSVLMKITDHTEAIVGDIAPHWVNIPPQSEVYKCTPIETEPHTRLTFQLFVRTGRNTFETSKTINIITPKENTSALLVGCSYTQMKPLFGTENDVKRMKGVLKHGFGFKNIVTLVGEEATCVNILKQMRKLEERVNSGIVVLYFSGHGGTKEGGTKGDTDDEGFLPSDIGVMASPRARTPTIKRVWKGNGYALTGYVFNPFLQKLLSRNEDIRVALLFDCCYAEAIPKQCDNESLRTKSHAELIFRFHEEHEGLKIPELSAEQRARYVLLAAASHNNPSFERLDREQKMAGSFTLAIEESLAAHFSAQRTGQSPSRTTNLTYRKLKRKVKRQMKGFGAPILDGNREIPVFSADAISPRRRSLSESSLGTPFRLSQTPPVTRREIELTKKKGRSLSALGAREKDRKKKLNRTATSKGNISLSVWISAHEDRKRLWKLDLAGMHHEVPYEVDENGRKEWLDTIKEAVDAVNSLSLGIIWRPKVEGDIDYVFFKVNDEENPSSLIGRHENMQIINLPNRFNKNLIKRGVVLHEMCHAMGLEHEHSRRDRGDYVEVKKPIPNLLDLILGKKEKEEKKEEDINIQRRGIPFGVYDRCSIMHYRHGCGIWVKSKPWRECAGKGNDLSSGDRACLRRLYGKPGTHIGEVELYDKEFELWTCCKLPKKSIVDCPARQHQGFYHDPRLRARGAAEHCHQGCLLTNEAHWCCCGKRDIMDPCQEVDKGHFPSILEKYNIFE